MPTRPRYLLAALALPAVLLSWPGPPARAAVSLQDLPRPLPEGHSEHGAAFNEGPRQGAYLMRGTGDVHFPVTAASGALQQLFDQGVGQLHGFWYFEAERTFRQIASEDPDCAMAYWGLALANVENPQRAAVFARAAWLKRGLASERERMYIDAIARFHQADGPEESDPQETADDAAEEGERPLLTLEQKALRERQEEEARTALEERARRLVEDYEALLWAYPDDIEAKAFLVNRLWLNRDLGLPLTSRAANEALLQQIFAVEPLHPAHHYRIHLWDAEENAEHVVESAVECGPSAPGIAHMWHMGGHVFARLGRHSDAAWQQEASARVDHAQMARDWVLPDQIHNFAHNNEWLVTSLRHHGRVREALRLAQNMIELPRHPRYNTLDQRGSAAYGRASLLETLELSEQWDRLVELADSMYLEPSEQASDGALRAFALGKAYAHLEAAGAGATEGFEQQLAALEAMLARSKAERAEALDETEERALALGFEDQDLRAALDDVLDEFAPELDDVRDKLASLRALRGALGALRSGPRPDGDESVQAQLEALAETDFDRAHLARLYLQAGRAADDQALLERAVELAREAVEDHDGELHPHAALAEILFATGATEEALEVFDRLRAWTARADPELPALQRLAPLAQALGLPADWRPAPSWPADVGERVDLETLGPLEWTPPAAPDWTLTDAFGEQVSLSDYRGRPVLAIFFLGFGCVHCVEQLQAFAPAHDEYAAAGIEIVAIGTNTADELRASFGDDPRDTGYPFRVLADPELAQFKRYRAHDDFEDLPLHGTFLIDGHGRVRWQDVSHEPFMDQEFLLAESQRLLALERERELERGAAASSAGGGASAPAAGGAGGR